MKVLIATQNPGKFREISSILWEGGLRLELVSLADFPDYLPPSEEGETFLENAVAKALAAARHTGLPAIAEDSGLSVQKLGGAPGVRSARYAGPDAGDEDNIRKLLREMEGVPPAERLAMFICVAVFADSAGRVETVTGTCEGFITTEPMGTGGFGYDPVFFSPELGKTFAQAAPEEKARVSHRGKAFRELASLLGHLYPEFLGN